MSTLACRLNQDVEERGTARWLLSNLVVHLQHHISYTCSVRKHGTLLYYFVQHTEFITSGREEAPETLVLIVKLSFLRLVRVVYMNISESWRQLLDIL